MNLTEIAQKAKTASKICRTLNAVTRQQALSNIAKAITNNSAEIITANEIDLAAGKASGLPAALLDRLKLNAERIQSLAESISNVARQPEVVGEIVSRKTRADGLEIIRERVPLGVILMIFESRPNVLVEAAALAIKSGNCILLKGGKEAQNSNHVLGKTIKTAISSILPDGTVQVLDIERSQLKDLLSLNHLIDLCIPRGGESLVKYVYENSKIPVVAHYKGICHLYIDKSANLEDSRKVALNAKLQRPGVCNAMETLLLHKDLPVNFLESLLQDFLAAGTEIFADSETHTRFPTLPLKAATVVNYQTEYLANKMSLRCVTDVRQAVEHINTYGSNHTEAIMAEDQTALDYFRTNVDASCVMLNSSTRFNDGGELGLGAELGISTGKLHAYGPMGAAEITTLRYVVVGKGHIRE